MIILVAILGILMSLSVIGLVGVWFSIFWFSWYQVLFMFVGFLILATITSEVLKELNKRKNNEKSK